MFLSVWLSGTLRGWHIGLLNLFGFIASHSHKLGTPLP